MSPRGFSPYKPGFRILGIAESFNPALGEKSFLAGVVERADMIIDGFVVGQCTVGGMDSTGAIIEMYRELGRGDINLIMLGGCVISLFNIVDLAKVSEETGLPLICVTYNPSEGLEQIIRDRFPHDWEERLRVYSANGPREEVLLKTGYKVYVRWIGLSRRSAEVVLNRFTVSGRVPEPVRVARLLARSLLRLGAKTHLQAGP
ncbi:MAG: DUF99 family protein [Candidatus Caldarchaeales archaeon]|nr:DUF99 family protein [Candidatus Caldarchaeales archaeon]MDT7915389.1 DUF99 family protein [Candidatus Caldarchaeales archaeon]